jgi:hypothetical protein
MRRRRSPSERLWRARTDPAGNTSFPTCAFVGSVSRSRPAGRPVPGGRALPGQNPPERLLRGLTDPWGVGMY